MEHCVSFPAASFGKTFDRDEEAKCFLWLWAFQNKQRKDSTFIVRFCWQPRCGHKWHEKQDSENSWWKLCVGNGPNIDHFDRWPRSATRELPHDESVLDMFQDPFLNTIEKHYTTLWWCLAPCGFCILLLCRWLADEDEHLRLPLPGVLHFFLAATSLNEHIIRHCLQ